MSLRRIATAASTLIVGIVLALSVPFAQLVTAADRVECCCPNPDTCKCPDHQPDDGHGDTTMRACHKQPPDRVTTQLAAFIAPVAAVAIAPAQLAPRDPHVLVSPKQDAPPRRPDAPS